MPTINQLIKKSRIKKNKLKKNLLVEAPQKKGIVLQTLTISPRKPNSANRKVVKVKLTNSFIINAYVPGESHNLQEHSVILIRGGRTKDLPGYKYKVVRGKYDSNGVLNRKTARSKYGVKKNIS